MKQSYVLLRDFSVTLSTGLKTRAVGREERHTQEHVCFLKRGTLHCLSNSCIYHLREFKAIMHIELLRNFIIIWRFLKDMAGL